MSKRFVATLAPVLGVVAIGVAAIVFGEADDAPGLVMLGLLLILAALAFVVSPVLRTSSRVIGLLLGAIVLAAIGSGVAGWLESNLLGQSTT